VVPEKQVGPQIIMPHGLFMMLMVVTAFNILETIMQVVAPVATTVLASQKKAQVDSVAAATQASLELLILAVGVAAMTVLEVRVW
jgi:hypothetical protein